MPGTTHCRFPSRCRAICAWLVLLAASSMAWAAEPAFELDVDATASDGEIASSIAAMAQAMLASRDSGGFETSEEDLAHLRIAAGQDTAVAAVVALMRRLQAEGETAKAQRWAPYLAYARARSEPAGFDAGYARALRGHLSGLDDPEAQRTVYWFVGDAERAQAELRQRLEPGVGASGIPLAGALELARRQSFVDVYRSAARLAPALVREDEERRYLVDDQVLIRTPQGATLSATVVRSRNADGPLPTAMLFTIYTAPEANRATAVEAASRGYAGVVVDARGKRLSEDRIAPYEHEADDAHAAIDWISRQPWSDGRVAMYGGSYSGFAAWAATRRMHPALKTIVPYVAAIPGLGLPMENNVFLSANYAWPFYVANNRLLDHETYGQRERWNALTENWFASGRPYREIDDVDGMPNPWLQRWLSHPAYDAYWQAMVPYGDEFARIDIPVLSITGYYDDGQVSALQYFKEHHRHRPGAEHYLLIGPYDHFGAQAPFKQRVLRGYEIDPSAQFDTREITFQWLDHVLRGAQRPALVRDKVNYQWMGGDAWRHAPSLAAAATPVAFHLVGNGSGAYHRLSRDAAPMAPPLRQTVDFADRTTQGHGYYPSPIVRDAIEVDSGFAFVSEPFERPTSVVGTFSGELKVRIDTRDFDFTAVLHELRPDGSAMQLSYFVGRASHARDMTRRELLVPGEWTRIPFERSRMTARRMAPGSRLLVVVDVLKDAHHQVNHGTGHDVSDESLADATAPLTVEWHPDSVIHVPLRMEDAQ